MVPLSTDIGLFYAHNLSELSPCSILCTVNYSLSALSILCGSVLLLVAVSLSSRPTQTAPSVGTWGSGTVVTLGTLQYAQTPEQATLSQQSVLLPSLSSSDPTPVSSPTEGHASASPVPQTNTSFVTEVPDIWSLFSTGLLKLKGNATPTRSAFQESLYGYGNDAGQVLENLDAQYGGRQVSIMKDFYTDRSNTAKQQKVKELANALSETGDALVSLSVPESVTSLNTKLANGYRDLGTLLTQIPDAKGDEDLLAKINSYNTAAETFVTAYVSLAGFF